MRLLTSLCLLCLIACDDPNAAVPPADPNAAPAEPEAPWEPELTPHDLRCQAEAPRLDLVGDRFYLELGRQGGAHIVVDFDVAGLAAGETVLVMDIYDGARRLQTSRRAVHYNWIEGCSVRHQITFDTDALYWELVDHADAARSLRLVLGTEGGGVSQAGEWTRPVEAVDAFE